jgi:uncharacterized SAM-binding protein YcdF (DUF218 family)
VRLGRFLVACATAFLFIVLIAPIDEWLSRPLENRFPRPPWPAHIDGILVLGGGLHPQMLRLRGVPALERSEGRVVEGVVASRHYPDAKLVFSGGSGLLTSEGAEADVAGAIFQGLGVDMHHVVLEKQSRDTWENFLDSRALVKPKPGEHWLLVTSALHMPRAMGVAARLGWPMIPWPAYYTTYPHAQGLGFSWPVRFTTTARNLEEAVHEWAGLIAYRLAGRTCAWFPSSARCDE